MLYLEAQQDLARHLNLDFTSLQNGTNQLFLLSDIQDFVLTGIKRAWDYKPWSFTKRTYKLIVTADPITGGLSEYQDYPEDIEDESLERLSINGVPYEKVIWDDFQNWMSNNPSDTTAKIWSETGRVYFINRNTYSIGDEINVTGKLRAPTPSADTDLLPFSPSTDNQENSGNHACIMFAYSDALSSDKLKRSQDSELRDKEAKEILDALWKPIAERRAKAQSKDNPMFHTNDMFSDRSSSSQNNIGNFNIF